VIDPRTSVGAVHLTVSDLDRSVRFYQRLGFTLRLLEGRTAHFGAGSSDLIVLAERRSAPRPSGTTGLYHVAILVPSRADLARALARLIETDIPLEGAADHGVSEALYLADPDGNGLEIYRDRPRTEWPIADGRLHMGTRPIDFDGLRGAMAAGLVASGLEEGTTVGHVHLHVSRLDDAERFYVGLLGFDLMQRYGPGALFVSAGGYHHHVGLNTWAGVGAPPPPDGAIGLRHFVLRLPDAGALDAVVGRLHAARVPVDPSEDGVLVRDPSANAILLTAAGQA
jgi:catechol 2,3-dioxygenase